MSEQLDPIAAAKAVLMSEASDEEAIGGKETKDVTGKGVEVMKPKATDNKKNKKEIDAEASDAEAEVVDDPKALAGSKEAEKVAVESVEVEEDETIKEHMDALFGGEEISEDFRNKAEVIFKSAINERVEAKVASIQEEFDAKLETETQTIAEELTNKLDEYLNYVIKEWAEENEVAIEHGLKNEISESFIADLRDLFEKHDISVPEGQYDALEEANSKVAVLEEKLNEQLESNAKLVAESERLERDKIFAESCEGLVDTDREKLQSLAEGLEFDSTEQYAEKLAILKESYFAEETVVTEETVEEAKDLNEAVAPVETGSVMDKYTSSLSRVASRPRLSTQITK